jgi:ketosteroid isomerase-like protein
MLDEESLKKLVLASFNAERTNNISENNTLIHDEFTFTDMVVGEDNEIFPSLGGPKLQELISEAFIIKGREFIFKNVLADESEQTVIVEFIESYPDPKSGKVYRTPQVAICKVKDGKIYRTRHYMDPRLSYLYLDQKSIDKAFQ